MPVALDACRPRCTAHLTRAEFNRHASRECCVLGARAFSLLGAAAGRHSMTSSSPWSGSSFEPEFIRAHRFLSKLLRPVGRHRLPASRGQCRCQFSATTSRSSRLSRASRPSAGSDQGPREGRAAADGARAGLDALRIGSTHEPSACFRASSGELIVATEAMVVGSAVTPCSVTSREPNLSVARRRPSSARARGVARQTHPGPMLARHSTNGAPAAPAHALRV
jgi:hypothetical protein